MEQVPSTPQWSQLACYLQRRPAPLQEQLPSTPQCSQLACYSEKSAPLHPKPNLRNGAIFVSAWISKKQIKIHISSGPGKRFLALSFTFIWCIIFVCFRVFEGYFCLRASRGVVLGVLLIGLHTQLIIIFLRASRGVISFLSCSCPQVLFYLFFSALRAG